MRDVSAGFLEAVRQSHPMRTRVRVVDGWQTGTNPKSAAVPGIDPKGEGIPVIDGSVSYDVTADILGTLSLTTVGAGWDPRPGKHPLQPYGTEVFVERGLPGELVPLGYFRLNSVDQSQPPSGPLSIQGQDRMAGLVEAKLTAPIQFRGSGTNVGDVFRQLVQDVYPAAVIEFDDDLGSEPIGRDQIVDQDRYGFLRDLATSNGKLMHFDERGVLVIRSLPDLNTPVWDVTAGTNGVLVEATRSIDRDGVFNATVVEGEAPDGDKPAVRAVAYDANTESPTYWEGTFGKVPYFYTSSNITRSQQAVSAARAILERNIGLPYYADFGALPNPALETYDPIRVEYSDRSAREIHAIQTLAVPLKAGDGGTGAPMTGTTRERTTVRISVEGVDS